MSYDFSKCLRTRKWFIIGIDVKYKVPSSYRFALESRIALYWPQRRIEAAALRGIGWEWHEAVQQ